jgi:hypothetical protein
MKSLMEWLTAETILSRPRDPVTCCRDLLSQQIKARGGEPDVEEQNRSKDSLRC